MPKSPTTIASVDIELPSRPTLRLHRGFDAVTFCAVAASRFSRLSSPSRINLELIAKIKVVPTECSACSRHSPTGFEGMKRSAFSASGEYSSF